MKEPQQTNSNLKRSLPTNSPISDFCDRFRLIVAATPKLREEVYRIRYQVYCQELGYERKEDCPNGLEQDSYDSRSIHCLLLHSTSGLYAGCVRLVLPQLYSQDANLPFERIYGPTTAREIQQKNWQKQTLGEVSRLAVPVKFRKRPVGEPVGICDMFSEQDRHCFPLIAFGLYLAATSVAIEVGLESAFGLMEPRLARHLTNFGIKFRQIGELVEFHGQRGLFQITREEVLNGMDTKTSELFQKLRFEAKKSLNQLAPICKRRAA